MKSLFLSLCLCVLFFSPLGAQENQTKYDKLEMNLLKLMQLQNESWNESVSMRKEFEQEISNLLTFKAQSLNELNTLKEFLKAQDQRVLSLETEASSLSSSLTKVSELSESLEKENQTLRKKNQLLRTGLWVALGILGISITLHFTGG